MTIETLIKAIPPPANPTYAFDEPWDTIQSTLGLQLPMDYKELVRLYGAGRFLEFFDIYGPKAPTLEKRLTNAVHSVRADFLQAVQGSLFFDDPPLPIWPRPGGLLPCGETANGDNLFWLTRGLASEWPVVLWDFERGTLEGFENDLTDFLAGVADGSIHSASFPGRWSSAAGVPAFRPAPPWTPDPPRE